MPLRDDPTLWFNLPGIVAAYQPVVAPGPDIARYNQMHGGTHVYRAADGVAPSWGAATGWTFASASAQYLNSGIVPGAAYTLIVRMSDGGSTAWQALAGCYTDRYSNSFFLERTYGVSRAYSYGSVDNWIAGIMDTGVYAMVGGVAGYKDGLLDIALTGAWSGAQSRSIYIGARNANGSPDEYSDCKIQAVAIYNRPLSAAEVWLISQQIKYCDVNPEWSAWGRRREWWHVVGPFVAYTQAAAGAQTNTGAIARRTATAKAGAQTNTGAIAKAIGTSETGTFPPSGGVVRETATSKAGAWSGAGAIVRDVGKGAAGAWSASGALATARGYVRALTGAWSASGTVTRDIGKVVAGAWSGAGGLARAIAKAISGAWSGIGALVTLLVHTTPTPGSRTYTPPAESRTYTPPAEDRTYTVEGE